jgi:hypothetical protein
MILIDFWFNEGMIVELLGSLLIWGPYGLLLFSAISLADGTGTESILDRWLPCNYCVLLCL